MRPTPRALAARFYEAINAGDLDPAVAMLADDVVWHRPPDVPVTGVVEGREKVRRMWAAFTEPLDRFEIEPTGYEEAGARVLVRITMRGSAPEAGVTSSSPVPRCSAARTDGSPRSSSSGRSRRRARP